MRSTSSTSAVTAQNMSSLGSAVKRDIEVMQSKTRPISEHSRSSEGSSSLGRDGAPPILPRTSASSPQRADSVDANRNLSSPPATKPKPPVHQSMPHQPSPQLPPKRRINQQILPNQSRL
ncbi:hypothetical protein AB6A40_010998 [Gnathostoma spinigerum]|uniref:Uncharacterized protein n=1 Tax=Gnathostoma spinigerum TaxID=75299 RepID=A0ABD6F2M1_9BILA